MNEKLIDYTLLDYGFDMILIRLDAPALLNLRQKNKPFAIKTVRRIAEIDSVSSVFGAPPMDEPELRNNESANAVRELPIMRPTGKMFKKIRHWLHLADIPFKEIDGKIMVLIGCDVPEAHWFLEQVEW